MTPSNLFTSQSLTVLVFADLPRHEGPIRKYEALATAAAEKGFKVELVIRPHTVLGAFSLYKKAWCAEGDIWVRFSGLFIALLPALVYQRSKGRKMLLEMPTPLLIPRGRSNRVIMSLFSILAWSFKSLSYKLARSISHHEATYVPVGFLSQANTKNSRAPILLANWADFSKIEVSQRPIQSSVLRMIFVANVSVQHGLDRVLQGMAVYRNAHLTVVGSGRDLLAQKELADALGLHDRVEFTGPLRGAALDKAFEGQHVALSVFGFHRIGVEVGSPLKTREYAARGLPVVGAYKDVAIPEGSSFPFLCLPANDEPIDLSLIREFALRHQNRVAVRAAGVELFDVRHVIGPIL